MTNTKQSALRLSGVSKSFVGVHALRGVDLDVGPHEIHAVLGENGAGKSTLVAVAAGELACDEGVVAIGGEPLPAATPRAAQYLGVAHVHQHPALAPDLTVAENIYLGVPRDRRPNLKRVDAWATKILDAACADISPRVEARGLSAAEWHLIEVAKALYLEPRVLILDEPTEFLDRERIDILFDQVRAVAARGAGVVYISHRIREVVEIAHRMTILRDGAVRGTFEAGEVDEQDVVNAIVGQPVETLFPDKSEPGAGDPVLRVQGLSGAGFHDVDLEVGRNEIVGLGGIEGNGQRELMRALAGAGQVSGSVELDGRPYPLGNVAKACRDGVVYIPADRHREALFMTMPVRPNATPMALGQYARGGLMSARREKAAVRQVVGDLAIRTPSTETGVAQLSGGNQQKVMMARAILARPKLLLVDEPTQGVDVAGRMEIFRILREAASQGVAVVVVAGDALELAGVCDRVAILSRGRIATELRGEEVSEANITGAALRSTTLRPSAPASRRPSKLRELLRRDRLASIVLALTVLLLGLYAMSINSSYLSQDNIEGVLLLMTAIGFVGIGQQIVVMVGSLDLSVGPLTGLLVVVGSFFFVSWSVPQIVIGLVVLLAVCGLVGVLNAILAEGLKINPIVATLATYFILQGLSLTLRPRPAGLIDQRLSDAITTTFGAIPVATIVVVALAVTLQISLRRSRWGLTLRSVGSDDAASARIGLPVRWVRASAYVACSLCCLGTGLLLTAQVGIGDPSTGTSYTLSSVTAVVLGGAAVTGGRGSFVGALLGAALIQQVIVVSEFLHLDQSWSYWLLGGLALAAVIGYSRDWLGADRGKRSTVT